jgi:mRNA interferase HigB
MRVHLIKKQTIEDFVKENAAGRIPFTEWLSKMKFAEWNTAADIKKTFASSDLLGKGSERVVFDIGGNNFRMICKYMFGEKQVHLFVCWLGTHAAYDKLCKANKQYTIDDY